MIAQVQPFCRHSPLADCRLGAQHQGHQNLVHNIKAIKTWCTTSRPSKLGAQHQGHQNLVHNIKAIKT